MPFALRILVLITLFAINLSAIQSSSPAESCTSTSSNVDERSCANPLSTDTNSQPYSKPWIKRLFPPGDARQTSQTSVEKAPVTIKSVIFGLPKDQVTIWTSPFHIRTRDLIWVAPLALTSGVLINSDRHSLVRARSNTLAVNRSTQISNYGLAAMLAWPALTYVVGQDTGSSRAKETGLLSAEAAVNSLAVNEVLKIATARERPTLVDGQGRFWKDVGNGSFPSTHSMLAWSTASVLAHEYPGPLTQALAYGAASAISISRITARQHFPSDVVVGAATGWLIGRQIYRAHSSNIDEDANYGTFVDDSNASREIRPSTYVPLDSWIYPALQRLGALGYIPSQFTGVKPWTQQECLRQADEAEYFTQDLPSESEIRQTIDSLKEELSSITEHHPSAQIESVYARYMNISGAPLRDSYHFGQTISNDFGRPYDHGNNLIAGASASAVAGRFFFYAQGEFEHAPGRPANTQTVQNLIASLDVNNPMPAAPVGEINRFYPLDMYAGVQLNGYALTFGKQSLWLGPGESAPLMVSDNADPMYMLRLVHSSPFYLPGIFKHLGLVQDEYLFSKLSGHHFPARPFFNLQKISLHPTKNLEVGFTRASLWAGVGHPFTGRSLARNLFSFNDSPGTSLGLADPGDRKSGFDFSYRIPGLRNWLTIYSDMYSDDDPSPIANPRRAAVNPGIYLSHVPGIPKLDLRFETVSTQLLTSLDHGGRFLYFNINYHDSNLNKSVLFGNSTGRDGRAYQSWTKYYFAPGRTLEFSYRQIKIGNAFLPGGGTQSDAIGRLAWRLGSNWTIDSFVQYERWLVPVLRPTAQSDVSSSVQVTFHPNWRLSRHAMKPDVSNP